MPFENREQKINAIKSIVDNTIQIFAGTFENRHLAEVDNPMGTINAKQRNVFINELGDEFMYYSSLVRSFDSSFGKMLERMGNMIGALSYDVRGEISSYILPQQKQHIDYLMTHYDNEVPILDDYEGFNCPHPQDVRSYEMVHQTDNYFYSKADNTHYLIELKAGGDLDNKKAKSEKIALLTEYFLLKNKLRGTGQRVKIIFGTAYNKFGEGEPWVQQRVRKYFAQDELMIGTDYWNFICDESNGFEIVMEQYRESARYIRETLARLKNEYYG